MTNYYKKYLILDIESTGKYPWDSKICCIGVKIFDTLETKTFFNNNEEELIIEFMRFYNNHKFDGIVGFNISHDHRFIVSKCLKYRIPLKNFQYVKLLDVMKILKGSYKGYNMNKPGKLDEWAIFLIGRGKLRINKSVKELLSENRIDEILEYNKTDVELTYRIFERIDQVMVV